MQNPFQRKKPIEFKPKVLKEKKDNCEIKIKETKQGKVLQFKGQCSREQLSLAKANLGIENDEKEEN